MTAVQNRYGRSNELSSLESRCGPLLGIIATSKARIPLAGHKESPEIAELLSVESTYKIARSLERRWLDLLERVSERLEGKRYHYASKSDHQKPLAREDARHEEHMTDNEERNRENMD